jgi:dTDP-glucose pyrophosphorylase
MSTSNWRDTVLSPDATLSAALRSLDATTLQIVLVLDIEGRLQGTLTDGDVRRALIRGESLDSPVSAYMKVRPVTIAVGTSSREALDVLQRMAIRSAPVLDDGGRVTNLVTLNDLIAPVERETPAVIMAGGRGARLRPLTDSTPKPLIPIGGEPLIDITTRRLVSCGFRKIWVTIHYRANEIKEHLRSGEHLGADICYLTESQPLGTVGAVREVPVSGADTPILVCNSDNLHTIDFGALVDHHTNSGSWATLAVTRHITQVPFGVVTIENGFIADLVEKPHRSDWVASGVSVMTQRALSLFPEGQHLDVPTVISELLNRGLPAGAFEDSGYWSDVGGPDTLDRVRSEHEVPSDTHRIGST